MSKDRDAKQRIFNKGVKDQIQKHRERGIRVTPEKREQIEKSVSRIVNRISR
jgi:hypothetical protein